VAFKLRFPYHMLYEYGSFCRRIKNFCFFITSHSYNVAFLKRYRFLHLITYMRYAIARALMTRCTALHKCIPLLNCNVKDRFSGNRFQLTSSISCLSRLIATSGLVVAVWHPKEFCRPVTNERRLKVRLTNFACKWFSPESQSQAALFHG
jgi:hypothetical protein